MLKLLFKKNYKKDTFQMLSIRFKINKGSVFYPFSPHCCIPVPTTILGTWEKRNTYLENMRIKCLTTYFFKGT